METKVKNLKISYNGAIKTHKEIPKTMDELNSIVQAHSNLKKDYEIAYQKLGGKEKVQIETYDDFREAMGFFSSINQTFLTLHITARENVCQNSAIADSSGLTEFQDDNDCSRQEEEDNTSHSEARSPSLTSSLELVEVDEANTITVDCTHEVAVKQENSTSEAQASSPAQDDNDCSRQEEEDNTSHSEARSPSLTYPLESVEVDEANRNTVDCTHEVPVQQENSISEVQASSLAQDDNDSSRQEEEDNTSHSEARSPSLTSSQALVEVDEANRNTVDCTHKVPLHQENSTSEVQAPIAAQESNNLPQAENVCSMEQESFQSSSHEPPLLLDGTQEDASMMGDSLYNADVNNASVIGVSAESFCQELDVSSFFELSHHETEKAGDEQKILCEDEVEKWVILKEADETKLAVDCEESKIQLARELLNMNSVDLCDSFKMSREFSRSDSGLSLCLGPLTLPKEQKQESAAGMSMMDDFTNSPISHPSMHIMKRPINQKSTVLELAFSVIRSAEAEIEALGKRAEAEIEALGKKVNEKTKPIREKAASEFSSLKKSMSERTKPMKEDLEVFKLQARGRCSKAFQTVKSKFEDFGQKVSQELQSGVQKVSQDLQSGTQFIEGKWENFEKSIQQHLERLNDSDKKIAAPNVQTRPDKICDTDKKSSDP